MTPALPKSVFLVSGSHDSFLTGPSLSMLLSLPLKLGLEEADTKPAPRLFFFKLPLETVGEETSQQATQS